ncbi:HTH-type transcriptional regulator GbpR [Pigmentiphaga humi]|uniref:HTH-type transcriptional regulator GbpR n=1 Tax=Pigmentiphaga humi TaxID=2478468 RepID=A0A3P4B868_9BURK|nr:LysR family transcriptional regulator [Pigmentiphaga humi]VCU71355.1 HTH-type transcriptional regulator GbpR [Pigmentiphaga humi]
MNLADLYMFERIAELGTLSLAARTVGRTQPALTKCVDRLEAEFGAPLLQRSGRLLRLTESGQVLLASAKRMRLASAQAKQQIADLASGHVGAVRIGIGAPALEHLLPGVTAQLLRQTPGATLELSIGTSDMLDTALRQGDIDVRIGPAPTVLDGSLEYRFLWQEESVIAARRGHALVRRGVTVADLGDAGWALPEHSIPPREWLYELLHRHGLPPPRVVIKASLIQIQPLLIAATDLLTVVSRRSLEATTIGTQLAEVPLKDTVFKRDFGVCWLRDTYLSPATRILLDILQETAARPAAGTAGRISPEGRPRRMRVGLRKPPSGAV